MLQVRVTLQVRQSPYTYAGPVGQSELVIDVPENTMQLYLDNTLVVLLLAAYEDYQKATKKDSEE